MFVQAAASVTDEEYPEDYQEYFGYQMEFFERRQPETWQETLSLFIELKHKVNLQDQHFLSAINAPLRSKEKC